MDEQELSGGATPERQPEKMFSQEDVNALVGRVKQQSAEKARQEVEREYQQRMMQQQQQGYASPQEGQQGGGIQPPSQAQTDALYQQVQERINAEMEAKMREMMDAEIQNRQVQYQATNLANMYEANVQKSREYYSDFDEVSKGFDPRSFPNLVYLVANMPNSGDILYELLKNPDKLNTIDELAGKAPQLAHAQLARLSQSIERNKNALAEADQYQVAEPLSPLTPSRVSGSNGKMTISDLRNQKHLRG